jgi:hypothetical protein
MPASDQLSVSVYHDGKRAPFFRTSAKKRAIIAALFAIATAAAWFVCGWVWILAPLAAALYFAVRGIIALRIAQRLEEMERTTI